MTDPTIDEVCSVIADLMRRKGVDCVIEECFEFMPQRNVEVFNWAHDRGRSVITTGGD